MKVFLSGGLQNAHHHSCESSVYTRRRTLHGHPCDCKKEEEEKKNAHIAPSCARDAGAYRTVCVELEVFGAAVNAVMVAEQLDDDVDCSFALNAAATAVSSAADSIGACDRAFRLLRALLAGWIEDVSHRGDRHADALLVGFYRWLCARSSLLYFPQLKQAVRDLMRRVHLRLVAELRRLGAVVVHASFHKVVIATTKTDAKEARDYLEFVTKTLAARPVFRYLSLRPAAIYAQLLFIDRHNFAAIELLDDDDHLDQHEEDDAHHVGADAAAAKRARRRSAGAGDGDDDDDDDDDDAQYLASDDEVGLDEEAGCDDPRSLGPPVKERRRLTQRRASRTARDEHLELELDELELDEAEDKAVAPRGAESSEEGVSSQPAVRERIVSDWSLANKLPELAKEYFMVIVGSFLHKPRQFELRLREAEQKRAANAAAAAAACEPRAGGGGGDDEDDEDQEPESVEEQSRAAVPMSREGFLQEFVSNFATEKLFGIVSELQHLSVRDDDHSVRSAPLDFAILVCHALALEKCCEVEVLRLRRLLLAHLGVREFAANSRVAQQETAVVLPDVICGFCNACDDLDLTNAAHKHEQDVHRDDSDEADAHAQSQSDARNTPKGRAAETPRRTAHCDKCGHRYDTLELELQLLEHLNELSLKMCTQDLRCAKCRNVATTTMSALCKCSGRFQTDVDRADFHDYLAAVKSVANEFNMQMLPELCHHLA